MNELKKILRLTAGVGEELIGCGAEISRVEETMDRIAAHYGVTHRQIYIISNGVFVNLEMGDDAKNISIRYIQDQSVDLTKLCELNALSRTIEKEDLTLDEALSRFHEIKYGKRNENKVLSILASGIGAAAFCYLIGGNLLDCVGALAGGLAAWLFLVLVEPLHMSKVLVNILGSLLATVFCGFVVMTGIVAHPDSAAIGSVVPLIPGVAFTNGIRDIADGDYISGLIRMVDALLVFICIAAGVCIGLKILGVR